MPVLHEVGPVLTEHHTCVENRRRPRERAGKRIDEESLWIDTCKPRRQRDKRADNGQHAAEEHRLEPIAVEPVLCRIDVGLLDEEVFPVFVYEGASAARADLIGKDGAEETANHPRKQSPRERHMLRKDKVARESKDEFARNRDAGVFRRHEHGDSDVAP